MNKLSGSKLLVMVCLMFTFLLVFGQPALAKKKSKQLVITQVDIDYETKLMTILGEKFDTGSEPVVVLCNKSFSGNGTGSDTITVDLTADGFSLESVLGLDCLLTVTTGKKKHQFDAYNLTIGAVGPQGEQGEAGEQGPQGEQGPRGLIGPQGDTGDQGDTGEKGDKGDTGATGAQGPAGPAGADGADGPKGDIGPAGPQGVQGQDGTDGADGATGPTGADGIDGAEGPAGADGVDGVDGLDATEALANKICPVGQYMIGFDEYGEILCEESGQGTDKDGDGYHTPIDCNDDNPDVHPGAAWHYVGYETTDGSTSHDWNCDGTIEKTIYGYTEALLLGEDRCHGSINLDTPVTCCGCTMQWKVAPAMWDNPLKKCVTPWNYARGFEAPPQPRAACR